MLGPDQIYNLNRKGYAVIISQKHARFRQTALQYLAKYYPEVDTKHYTGWLEHSLRGRDIEVVVANNKPIKISMRPYFPWHNEKYIINKGIIIPGIVQGYSQRRKHE